MLRYIRAFIQAVRMVLRGEAITSKPYYLLWEWMDEAEKLLDSVYLTATDQHLEKPDRESITRKVEGRDVSLETVLGGISHHLRQEYPYLLRRVTTHSITAIYASNMNDQYAIRAFTDFHENAELQDALEELSDHLQGIPPSTDLE